MVKLPLGCSTTYINCLCVGFDDGNRTFFMTSNVSCGLDNRAWIKCTNGDAWEQGGE
jgi:hypothetical protein